MTRSLPASACTRALCMMHSHSPPQPSSGLAHASAMQKRDNLERLKKEQKELAGEAAAQARDAEKKLVTVGGPAWRPHL